MLPNPLAWLCVAEEVRRALDQSLPVVALETTVITHGLPFPENLELAQQMEAEIRAVGAIPATIGVVEGKACVGFTPVQLEHLAKAKGLSKLSSRDIGPAVAQKLSGGTTVAGTLLVAHQVGIRVFATGGIGGVHREAPFDVSADLWQLAQSPLMVVCAGAKAILDIPATLEVLETFGVPVIGYQSDDFPAFYSRSSGCPVSVRVDSPAEVYRVAQAHWEAGMCSGLVVAQPPPESVALPRVVVDEAIKTALRLCRKRGLRGQQVTPFLLQQVSQLTHGASLQANLALLLNNARLAAQIALIFGK
jgi:pseudouridine-5'-phosphate glycosidase